MLVWLLTDADMTMSPRLLDDKNLARGRRKNELQSLSDAQTRAVNLPHHLMHYKKEGIVLIIRTILTKNMYHDHNYLTNQISETANELTES